MSNHGPDEDLNNYDVLRRARRRRESGKPHHGIREKLTPGKLGVGITIAAMCAVFGGRIYDSLYGNGQKTLSALEEVIGAPENKEQVKKSEMVPEDERSGKNLLVAAHPLGKLTYEGGYRQYFEETFTTMFNLLPKGTNIHLVVPENSREEALKVAKEMYPHLNFVAYDMPPTGPGIEYAQDTFFATGGFDKKGRSILAVSMLDDEYLDKGIMPQEEATPSFARLWPFHLDNVKADYSVPSFGDEFLAKRYPDKFVKKDVPVRVEGGDMHISRMPNGKVVLVVGRKNLVETAVFKDPETTERLGLYFNLAGPDFVLSNLENVRALYKEAFDVDDVVFLGEDFLYTLAREEYNKRIEVEDEYRMYENHPMHDRLVEQKSIVPVMSSFFFHLDMVLKTVTTPSGEKVAFCTDYTEAQARKYADQLISESMGEEAPEEYKLKLRDALQLEVEFLHAVQQQFRKLGYKVVKLPCGLYPALNYTNSVVFGGDGDEKIAIVPQYGIAEDAQALGAYRALGFKILASDYTDLIGATIKSSKSGTGRVLEELGVKNVSGGLSSIGSYHCRTVVLGELGQKVFYTPEDSVESEEAVKSGKVKSKKTDKVHDKHNGPTYKKHPTVVPKKGHVAPTRARIVKKDFQRRKV